LMMNGEARSRADLGQTKGWTMWACMRGAHTADPPASPASTPLAVKRTLETPVPGQRATGGGAADMMMLDDLELPLAWWAESGFPGGWACGGVRWAGVLYGEVL
jgi:hypothetical protein